MKGASRRSGFIVMQVVVRSSDPNGLYYWVEPDSSGCTWSRAHIFSKPSSARAAIRRTTRKNKMKGDYIIIKVRS